MRKIITYCLLTLLVLSGLDISLFAQKISDVVIEGNAEFAKGEEIRLIVFDDLLTYTPKTVAKAKIQKNGSYSLRYKTQQIALAQLVIRTSKAEFFIEPSHTYHFDISMDEQLFQLLEPEYYGGMLQIKNTQNDSEELNYKLNRFNAFYERIISYYQDDLSYFHDLNAFDTISKEVDQRFGLKYIPTDFYSSYVYYTIASTESIIREKYPKQLYEKYFDNEYILYNNPAYMNFFNGFYSNYLLNSHYINQSILGKYINDTPNYLSLFNEVGKDPLLVNERIRELVLIKNLGQFYNNEEFDQRNVVHLLDYIQQSTHFPEHKHIIDNVKAEMTRMQPGEPFAYVTFKEANGANFNLQRLQGKWIYIQVFNSSCEDCIREMLILKKIQEEYKDDLEIVSLSVDFEESKFVQFISRYREMFPWQFAHFNQQYDWLAQYDIGNLPDNLLIAPDGRLAMRYAPDASKDLAIFLKRLFDKGEEPDKNPLFYHPEN